MKNSHRPLVLSIFIFGSSAFGWVFGTGLHELGHAVSMWITGGVVNRITLTPFSWSYTYYGSPPKYPQFTTWSGVLLGSFFGLLILLWIRNKNSPYFVPFLYLGIAPMLQSGGYYFIDTFITKRGDAASLIQAGVPIYYVLGAGLALAFLGGIFFHQVFLSEWIIPQ